MIAGRMVRGVREKWGVWDRCCGAFWFLLGCVLWLGLRMTEKGISVNDKLILKLLVGSSFIIIFSITCYYINQAITIPADLDTKNILSCWAMEIYTFYEENQSLPDSLSEIPQREGYYYGFEDGWGHKIDYNCKENTITLRSLGRDNRPGGEGDDQDYEIITQPSAYSDFYEYIQSVHKQIQL